MRWNIQVVIHWQSFFVTERVVICISCRRSKPPGFTSSANGGKKPQAMMLQTRQFQPLPVYSTFLSSVHSLPSLICFNPLSLFCHARSAITMSCCSHVSVETLWCGPHGIGQLGDKRGAWKNVRERRFGLRGTITRQIPQRFRSLPLGVTRGKATQNCQISVELIPYLFVCTSSLSVRLHIAEVFSPPPRVSFSWRHWGHFTGSYEGTMCHG